MRSRSESPYRTPPHAAMHYWESMGVKRKRDDFLHELKRTYHGMLYDIIAKEADSELEPSDRKPERDATQAVFFARWRSQLESVHTAWSVRGAPSTRDREYLDDCKAYLTVWELEQDHIGDKLALIDIHILEITSCTQGPLVQEHIDCWLECQFAYQMVETYPNSAPHRDGTSRPFVSDTLDEQIWRREEDEAHAEAARRREQAKRETELSHIRADIREEERAYAQHEAQREEQARRQEDEERRQEDEEGGDY